MNEKNTGGPAFPVASHGSVSAHQVFEGGMTLRDYFAAHAPEPPERWRGGDRGVDDIIAWRWHYADAMLKAREA